MNRFAVLQVALWLLQLAVETPETLEVLVEERQDDDMRLVLQILERVMKRVVA